jgi:hypothetical protein
MFAKAAEERICAAISVLTRAIFDDSRFVPLSGSRIFA